MFCRRRHFARDITPVRGLPLDRSTYSSDSTNFSGTLLQHAPPGTSGILYVDVAQVRQSPFAQKLFAWAPKPEADAEYARFLQDTGFHYERDLHRVAFSAARRGSQSVWFAIADGSFDQKKIAAYLSKIAVLQKRDATTFI